MCLTCRTLVMTVFSIELGKPPYEYLYALTRMRQVNIINEMQSIHSSVSADILLRLDEC